MDQQLYDMAEHPAARGEGRQYAAQLSSRGFMVYNSFREAIILSTVHRLRTITTENLTDEDWAYNDRAASFLALLHRLRDLT